LGVVSIARLTDLDPTTAHRILKTLEEYRFVSQSSADGRYTLGTHVFMIGNSVKFITAMRQVARPFLQTLMLRTQQTANIAIKDSDNAIFIEQAIGPDFPRTLSEIGRSLPLHATSVGKVLVMDDANEFIKKIKSKGYDRFTKNTNTINEAVKSDLLRCAERGYALDIEEFETGANCISVPIRESNGKIICAIGISGSCARLTAERIQAYIPIVIQTAIEISQILKISPLCA
jgi:IclR family acetate operon transcriptional repressor